MLNKEDLEGKVAELRATMQREAAAVEQIKTQLAQHNGELKVYTELLAQVELEEGKKAQKPAQDDPQA
jgi:hypothetical protein